MLPIGQIAERFGLATHVLRHWEDVGLLVPQRDGAGRRRFSEADIARVAVILRSKAAGMSLEQIRALLDGQVADRHEVLTAHLEALDRQMAEMVRSKAMTEHALRCTAHDIAACPNFIAGVADIIASAGLDPDALWLRT